MTTPTYLDVDFTHVPTAKPAHTVRNLVVLGVAAALLAGCSSWPKILTFGSDTEPESKTTATAATAEPAPSPVVECQGCLNGTGPNTTPINRGEVAAAPIQPAAPAAPAPAPVPRTETPPSPTPKATPAEEPMGPKPKATVHTTKMTELVPGFYLNIGLFAVPANGANAFQKLEQAGFPVFSAALQTKRGAMTQVRVGPYTKRAEAEAAAKKIHALQLDAVVIKL